MKKDSSLLIIILLTSASVFGFWMISTPIIATAMVGVNLQITFGAPLIACGFAVLLPLIFNKKNRQINYARYFQLLTVLCIPLSLFLFTVVQSSIDHSLTEVIASYPKAKILSHVIWGIELKHHLYFIFSLSLPFIFYGAFISFCFTQSSDKKTPKVYSMELIGFFIGVVISAAILDYTSLQAVFTFIFFTSLISTWFVLEKKLFFISAIIFSSLVAMNWLTPHFFEPQRNLHWSARDFKEEKKVTEENRSWTTYSKVQKLKIGNSFLSSIADGTGFAGIPLKNSNYSRMPDILTWFFRPDKTLILFAGGGADILPLAKKSNFEMEITGLEINPIVVKNSLSHEGGALKDLIKRDNIELLNQEGRLYLERTKETFDSILFSWSGASQTHYVGVDLSTTQYLFTSESLNSAIHLLNKNGTLLISGNSKPSLIMSFLKTTTSSPNLNLKDSLVVVANQKHDKNNWAYFGEDSFLIFKKGNFTEPEVTRLNELVKTKGYYVALSPFKDNLEPKYKLMSEALQLNDHKQALEYFNKRSENFFWMVTDDVPFINRGIPSSEYDFSFLKKLFSLDKERFQMANIRTNLLRETIFVLCLFLVFLLYFYATTQSTKRNLSLIYNLSNALLGFFSSSLIILLTYKFILFYGNPTLSVVFSQSLTLVAGGFGSLAASFHFLSKKKNKYAFSVFILSSFFFSYFLITHPSVSKVFFTDFIGMPLLMLIVAPLPFATAYFFTINLKQIKTFDQSKMTATGLSINIMSAAAAAFIVPVLAESEGIASCFQLIFYVLIVILVLHLLNRHRDHQAGAQ